MASDITITREIAPLPSRADHAHKGDVGRVVIVGGCCNEVFMAGAPALAATAALRSGAGLVQLFVPESLRATVTSLAPCATSRTLPTSTAALLGALQEFAADVVAVGPGLGNSLQVAVLVGVLKELASPIVLDADGLNLLASTEPFEMPRPERIVLTPHPGEARRLLAARGQDADVGSTPAARRDAALRLVEAYGCTVVLKGHGTIVTNGDRLFVNETGNSGMATGGTGDVLTGMIAALIGQGLDPMEAAILAVCLHGLAGDFAAEELGRYSLTATDLIDYLPEAFCEYEVSGNE